MAYCLNNAFWNAYLLESLLRVYIWVRKYGTAVLAGPIVMIAAHRWRSNHDVSGPRWRLSGGYLGGSTVSIYDFKYRGCVRRPEKTWNVLSNVSCIKDEWQFKRLGRQYCQNYLFDCGWKWIRRIASIWRAKLSGESESLATDVIRISVAEGSGHVCLGKSNRPLLPSGGRGRMWNIQRKWDVDRTEWRLWDIRIR